MDSIHSESHNSTHTILDPILEQSHIEDSLSMTLRNEKAKE